MEHSSHDWSIHNLPSTLLHPSSALTSWEGGSCQDKKRCHFLCRKQQLHEGRAGAGQLQQQHTVMGQKALGHPEDAHSQLLVRFWLSLAWLMLILPVRHTLAKPGQQGLTQGSPSLTASPAWLDLVGP